MNAIADWLGISVDILDTVLWTVSLLVVYFTLRLALRRLVDRSVHEVSRRYTATKAVNTTLGLIAFIGLVLIWTRGGTGMAAYLGILSAGIAIALQDPLTNAAGFLFIAVRKPFAVGDRIEIGQHRGDVVDVRLFQFSVIEIGNWVDADQSTGRIIHVPNGLVFKNPMANYTHGFHFIWDELPITITFESDWKRAKELLSDLLVEHSKVASEQARMQIQAASSSYLVHYQHLTPIVWTSVADHGVTLTARYVCEPRRRRGSASELWEAVLEAFAGCDDIDFAYPTTRFYDNRAEGKAAAGGPPPAAGD